MCSDYCHSVCQTCFKIVTLALLQAALVAHCPVQHCFAVMLTDILARGSVNVAQTWVSIVFTGSWCIFKSQCWSLTCFCLLSCAQHILMLLYGLYLLLYHCILCSYCTSSPLVTLQRCVCYRAWHKLWLEWIDNYEGFKDVVPVVNLGNN